MVMFETRNLSFLTTEKLEITHLGELLKLVSLDFFFNVFRIFVTTFLSYTRATPKLNSHLIIVMTLLENFTYYSTSSRHQDAVIHKSFWSFSGQNQLELLFWRFLCNSIASKIYSFAPTHLSNGNFTAASGRYGHFQWVIDNCT